jgi:hypothetical protein
MGTKPSDMAAAIRAATCGCYGFHLSTCCFYGQPFHAPIIRY